MKSFKKWLSQMRCKHIWVEHWDRRYGHDPEWYCKRCDKRIEQSWRPVDLDVEEPKYPMGGIVSGSTDCNSAMDVGEVYISPQQQKMFDVLQNETPINITIDCDVDMEEIEKKIRSAMENGDIINWSTDGKDNN